jgi:hypothetical protein
MKNGHLAKLGLAASAGPAPGQSPSAGFASNVRRQIETALSRALERRLNQRNHAVVLFRIRWRLV